VLKGYGATHEHGRESFTLLMQAVDAFTGSDDDAARLARLRTAALADEDGATLRSALGQRAVAAVKSVG
jgi:indolepyruvate ferredoxin oxidoreductase beta subunit